VAQRSENMNTTEEKNVGSAAAVPISGKDQREIQDIYEKLRTADAKLVGPDGKTQILPSTLYSFLCTLLADLKAGHSVTILQSNASLTTVEASKLLGMSRQFLIGLLEKREIQCHMVGTHRRLYARDVLAYKAKRDAVRSKTLDDLARIEAEQGTYDKVPDDCKPGQ
jgi:excisionase family DNA binding protein